jgi:L1 cell adhesion molecule like protein
MRVIGIDLGTTYSSVGCMTNAGPQLIEDGNFVGVPSILAFRNRESKRGNGEWVVGRLAQECSWKDAKKKTKPIYDLKRMFGYSYDHPRIQEFIRTWPFEVERGPNGEILIRVEEGDEVKPYRPYELSAKILEKLKRMAEGRLGGSITDAVITVPASFNDGQREETKKAAKLAGLNVLRLLNEPCAGAIAYAYELGADRKETVIVFDLGGGTLDVALLTIERSRLTVLAVDGDIHLGGRDFDDRLMRLCLRRCGEFEHVRMESLDPEKLDQLRAKVEEAKCELSDAKFTTITFEDTDIEIERDEFEQECEEPPNLYDRMLRIIDRVLFVAGTRVADVDNVILIGGGSKMPKVRRIISDYMGKGVIEGTEPLEAVAKGATVFGVNLIEGRDIPDIQCEDICPLDLGICIEGGLMSVIIGRGEKLPVLEKKDTFYTTFHNQPMMTLDVYEGPWKMVKRNQLLGSLTVEGLPQAEAHETRVIVTFNVDCDGVLTVTARAEAGGESKVLTVEKKSHLFSAAKVSQTLEEYEREQTIDAMEFDETKRTVEAQTLARNFRDFLEQEPVRNWKFNAYVSTSEQKWLLNLVEEILPSALGRVPSVKEIEGVRKELQECVYRYMNRCRRGIPEWLTW